MKQLSLTDTQNLVSKLTKSLGTRGAARALNKMGYRSPENCEIKQGHVSRIQSGSWTCFLAPEEPPIEAISAPVPSPIAARPPVGEPTPEHYIESGPALASSSKDGVNLPHPLDGEEIEPTPDPREVRQRLKNELIAEEEARQDLEGMKEMNLPPLVPSPGDHSRGEHSNVQRFARPAAVFSRRQAIEIKTDEEGNEETFFGIPRLQHRPPTTMSRPYQPKSYGGNVVSTR